MSQTVLEAFPPKKGSVHDSPMSPPIPTGLLRRYGAGVGEIMSLEPELPDRDTFSECGLLESDGYILRERIAQIAVAGRAQRLVAEEEHGRLAAEVENLRSQIDSIAGYAGQKHARFWADFEASANFPIPTNWPRGKLGETVREASVSQPPSTVEDSPKPRRQRVRLRASTQSGIVVNQIHGNVVKASPSSPSRVPANRNRAEMEAATPTAPMSSPVRTNPKQTASMLDQMLKDLEKKVGQLSEVQPTSVPQLNQATHTQEASARFEQSADVHQFPTSLRLNATEELEQAETKQEKPEDKARERLHSAPIAYSEEGVDFEGGVVDVVAAMREKTEQWDAAMKSAEGSAPIHPVKADTTCASEKIYVVGQRVEVLRSSGQWEPAIVIGDVRSATSDKPEGYLEIAYTSGAGKKMIHRSKLSELVISSKATGYVVGQLVDYFSTTNRGWIPATVISVGASGYRVDKKPDYSVQSDKLRPRQAATYIAGQAVDYYSASQNRWIPATVIGVESNGYRIDRKLDSAVPAKKLRPRRKDDEQDSFHVDEDEALTNSMETADSPARIDANGDAVSSTSWRQIGARPIPDNQEARIGTTYAVPAQEVQIDARGGSVESDPDRETFPVRRRSMPWSMPLASDISVETVAVPLRESMITESVGRSISPPEETQYEYPDVVDNAMSPRFSSLKPHEKVLDRTHLNESPRVPTSRVPERLYSSPSAPSMQSRPSVPTRFSSCGGIPRTLDALRPLASVAIPVPSTPTSAAEVYAQLQAPKSAAEAYAQLQASTFTSYPSYIVGPLSSHRRSVSSSGHFPVGMPPAQSFTLPSTLPTVPAVSSSAPVQLGYPIQVGGYVGQPMSSRSVTPPVARGPLALNASGVFGGLPTSYSLGGSMPNLGSALQLPRTGSFRATTSSSVVMPAPVQRFSSTPGRIAREELNQKPTEEPPLPAPPTAKEVQAEEAPSPPPPMERVTPRRGRR